MHRKLLAALLGLCLTLAGLEGLLALGQWSFVRYQEHNVTAEPADGRPEYRILTLGESTTAVAGNDEGTMLGPTTSYPSQLQRILQDRHPQVRIVVQNNGMMGGTSSETIDRLQPSLESLQPHLVIAMMGIKDEIDQGDSNVVHSLLPRLRTIQLFRWLALSLDLHRNRVPADVDSIIELPEHIRARIHQQRRNIKETRLIDKPNPEASDDMELAIFLLNIQRHERAKEILLRTIEVHDLGYNILALVYATNDEVEAAIELLTSAARSHPREGMYRVSLINLLTTLQRFEEAERVLAGSFEALDTFQESQLVSQYLLLAACQLALGKGDGEEALVAIQRLKQLTNRLQAAGVQNPGGFPLVDMQARINRGQALVLLGRHAEAEKVFLNALNTQSRRMDAMWALAQVYRDLGRLEDEANIRRQLIAKRPQPGDYFELAKLFRMTGNDEAIPELFSEMSQRFPSLKRSHETLYELCRKAGAKLLVMQYPSFGPETIEAYAPSGPGVFLLDNEHVFDADPDGYFYEPDYQHSYSHYTRDGARVLAAHVADNISRIDEIDGI